MLLVAFVEVDNVNFAECYVFNEASLFLELAVFLVDYPDLSIYLELVSKLVLVEFTLFMGLCKEFTNFFNFSLS